MCSSDTVYRDGWKPSFPWRCYYFDCSFGCMYVAYYSNSMLAASCHTCWGKNTCPKPSRDVSTRGGRPPEIMKLFFSGRPKTQIRSQDRQPEHIDCSATAEPDDTVGTRCQQHVCTFGMEMACSQLARMGLVFMNQFGASSCAVSVSFFSWPLYSVVCPGLKAPTYLEVL